MAKPILITLLPSSGVDMGRWMMDHYQISYIERPHAPIFHILALLWWGMGKDDYPLLVRGREKLGGTTKIIASLESEAQDNLKLYPSDPGLYKEMDEYQSYARWTLGGEVVNWSYWYLLKYKSVVWPSVATSVPWYEKMTLAVAFPVIRKLMYVGLGLNQGVADNALEAIYKGFDYYDNILSDGRRYLVGGQFTWADIAVSASLGPMVLAQGYHGMLPNQAKCPVFMQKVYSELRARPTGQYIQHMYDLHRSPALLAL